MRNRTFATTSRALTLVALTSALGALAARAINPATGESQLTLFSEAEEIELGVEVPPRQTRSRKPFR